MEGFRDFIEVFEIDRLSQVDAQITPEYDDPDYEGNNFYYRFKVSSAGKREGYKAKFKGEYPIYSAKDDIITNDAYEILFYGPGLGGDADSMEQTDKRVWAQVYFYLLAGIKKFIEEKHPVGLSFYGATPGMDLVYTRLAE